MSKKIGWFMFLCGLGILTVYFFYLFFSYYTVR